MSFKLKFLIEIIVWRKITANSPEMNAELRYNHTFLINLLMVLNILRADSFKFIVP